MKTILSISSKNIKECSDLLNDMKILGIAGDITTNISIDQYGDVEHGCRIMIPGQNGFLKAGILWHAVKPKYDLWCAHIESPNFCGCVLDAFRESRCPSRVDDART